MPDVDDLVRRWALELDAVDGDVLDLACGSGQNGCDSWLCFENYFYCTTTVVASIAGEHTCTTAETNCTLQVVRSFVHTR